MYHNTLVRNSKFFFHHKKQNVAKLAEVGILNLFRLSEPRNNMSFSIMIIHMFRLWKRRKNVVRIVCRRMNVFWQFTYYDSTILLFTIKQFQLCHLKVAITRSKSSVTTETTAASQCAVSMRVGKLFTTEKTWSSCECGWTYLKRAHCKQRGERKLTNYYSKHTLTWSRTKKLLHKPLTLYTRAKLLMTLNSCRQDAYNKPFVICDPGLLYKAAHWRTDGQYVCVLLVRWYCQWLT